MLPRIWGDAPVGNHAVLEVIVDFDPSDGLPADPINDLDGEVLVINKGTGIVERNEPLSYVAGSAGVYQCGLAAGTYQEDVLYRNAFRLEDPFGEQIGGDFWAIGTIPDHTNPQA